MPTAHFVSSYCIPNLQGTKIEILWMLYVWRSEVLMSLILKGAVER
jgi:hypothetical protein